MAARVWMLELSRTDWRLTTMREEVLALVAEQSFADCELVNCPTSIQAALATDGYRGESIVLAIESDWCLTATLTIERRQELRDCQTLLYRLEEWIPWNAEDCVADFLPADKQALVVTVPKNPLAEFLTGLVTLGVEVGSIVPTALLACSEHLSGSDGGAAHVLILQQNDWIDIIKIERTQPVSWSWLPASAAALQQELKHLSFECGDTVPVTGYGLDDSLTEGSSSFHGLDGGPIRPAADSSRQSLAMKAAERIARGKLSSPLELKRSPFGSTSRHVALRQPLLAFQLAAAILLLTITASLLVRGEAGGREAARLAAQQEEAFRGVFPNAKIPVGIANRLESELAKLKGLQGDDVSLPNSVSVTNTLHRLLSALPNDRRLRLLEIRFEEGRIYLDGEVREHGDAEALAQRLRTQGFEIPPPKTQRMDEKRVSLRITGLLSRSDQVAGGKPR